VRCAKSDMAGPFSQALGGRRSTTLSLCRGPGEGTALHVESHRGRGHHLGDFSVRLSGSLTLTPSPSPGGEGDRFKDLCPRITNGHLDTRLTRLTPRSISGPRLQQVHGQKRASDPASITTARAVACWYWNCSSLVTIRSGTISVWLGMFPE